jgi:hypothetical protein
MLDRTCRRYSDGLQRAGNCLQMASREMEVHRRISELGMSEQQLDRSEICASTPSAITHRCWHSSRSASCRRKTPMEIETAMAGTLPTST